MILKNVGIKILITHQLQKNEQVLEVKYTGYVL